MINIFRKYLIQSVQFYLRHTPLELRYARASFSQFADDLALANFLSQPDGFYVDVDVERSRFAEFLIGGMR